MYVGERVERESREDRHGRRTDRDEVVCPWLYWSHCSLPYQVLSNLSFWSSCEVLIGNPTVSLALGLGDKYKAIIYAQFSFFFSFVSFPAIVIFA